jgi:hypothetical protein
MPRPYIFISYARKDASFAGRLKRRLQTSKLTAWRDVDDVRGGDNWQQAVDDALRGAAALVVVLSPAATKSEYVTYEWAFALGAGVRVVPVLQRTTPIHPRLTTIQYIDFRNTNQGKPWLRLLEALHEQRAELLIAEPEIHVAFALDENGKPIRSKREYLMLVDIRPLPAGASSATYELHDPSFLKPRWSEHNSQENFATRISSYGDVLLSATMKAGAKKMRLETTLHGALLRSHGRDRRPGVVKALREIAEN